MAHLHAAEASATSSFVPLSRVGSVTAEMQGSGGDGHVEATCPIDPCLEGGPQGGAGAGWGGSGPTAAIRRGAAAPMTSVGKDQSADGCDQDGVDEELSPKRLEAPAVSPSAEEEGPWSWRDFERPPSLLDWPDNSA